MQITRDSRFQIPSTLRDQLLSFRRRVWCFKLLEAVAAAAIGLLLGFLLTYLLDRVVDTPKWMRGTILLASVLCCLAIPLAIQRWVWRRRRFDQLAQLLAQTRPNAGDQLLGVIHLSEDQSEQARSPELVEAAIRQVASNVASEDFSKAIPKQRHRQRGLVASFLAVAAVVLFWITAAAATNAWARFLSPWSDIPRYTFASIEPLPDRLVVPHGEPFDLTLSLSDSSRWKPETALVSVAGQAAQRAQLTDDGYAFRIPGQITPLSLAIRVGDYRGQVGVDPTLRPELESLTAEVSLPEYLGRSETTRREIRGSTFSTVRGSRVVLTAQATRPLSMAWVSGQQRVPDGERFQTSEMTVDQSQELQFRWEDQYGLSGKDALSLKMEAIADEAPTLVCENLPRRKVLLDTEVLTFQVRAHDDFGVKRVGLEWLEIVEGNPGAVLGETMLGAGGVAAESLQLAATFCARDLKIAPQTIAVRVFAEDYFPNRPRSYAPLCVFEILDPAQHAIWVTSELTRWQRMSLDVRDRELQLHETNKVLRDLPAEELGSVETRQQLSRQAEQEQVNGRRLSNLVRNGEGLLREAMRNDEIGAEHLEKWAEMVQVLKDIADNRMPSVADLLKEASQGPPPSGNKPDQKPPQAGQNRLTQSASGEAPPQQEEKDSPPPTPSVSDVESTQLDLDSLPQEKPDDGPPQQGRLTLPDTKLAGNAKSESQPPSKDSPVEQAVIEQEGLLDEFEKVANDLNEVLANLEGSTLVKRLKAASRKQQQVAAGLASLITDSFGVPDREKHADAGTFGELSELESAASQDVSHLMDDMTAYFERSRLLLLQRVLEDMKDQDVTAELRALSDELRKENGLSISQAEYWSDTLDRWAEDLVEVTQSGASPGAKAKGSLPPAIVLEVLQLLDGEVKLREQTRVAEQARPAVTDTEHMEAATRLAETQDAYQQRVKKVVDEILQLPNAEGDFANELNMLAEVSGVMQETTEILYKPETGPPAIAAETEIIELLLKSKRFNPNASGGSGADPGGGGSGKTETPALALVGAGVNAKEVREEMSAVQSTGSSGPGLPEEYRSGLDEYFNRLEQWKAK